MKQNVLMKAIVIGGLGLVFLVPLMMITVIVSERAGYQRKVATEVAQSTARAQELVGPLVVVRFREVLAHGDGSTVVDRVEVLTPDTLAITTRTNVETRRRGIYRVPVFRATNRLVAAFSLPERFGIAPDRVLAGEPEAEIVFGVSDRRGLRASPVIRVGNDSLQTSPSRPLPWPGDGVAAALPAGARGPMTVEVEAEVMGTDRLMFLPVGATTTATMTSNWPHPGFTGGFLPDEYRVGGDGFRATWHLSRFATGVEEAIARAGKPAPARPRDPEPRMQTAGFGDSDAGVRFVQPVDVYQQSERAVKYGILFVLLTFVAFFLYEVLQRLRVHPIQYTLCGGGLALFFLLLVSLAEHVPFAAAYVVASGACVGLLAFYVGHVLGSAWRGLAFGGLLAGLYGVLYVLLQSEDYALLLGSLLLFGVLAAIMTITRRVDWYRLQEEVTATRA